ncbi:MAG: secondary thiamine-phosphate synthase enzyme YjbQ [Dehalococcoidia bacterium]
MVTTERTRIQTRGNCDIIDITRYVSEAVKNSGIEEGTVTVFVAHSTCGISTVEYEPGLISDLQALFERIAPEGIPYKHNDKWGDGNGHAHVRSTLLGTSLVVPISDNHPILGTWQQVILIDFDNRARTREIIFQLMGE